MRRIILRMSFLSLCIPLPVFAQKAASDPLPAIPQKNLSVQQADQIREQLLAIREDVVSKMAQLKNSKLVYDQAKVEATAQLKKIAEERLLLDESLQKEKTLKEERVTDAITFLAKMDPRKAAPMWETMDSDLVLILMKRLPTRQVTQVLENVSSAKAAQFVEYFTRIRSGREFDMLRDMGLCAAASATANPPASK